MPGDISSLPDSSKCPAPLGHSVTQLLQVAPPPEIQRHIKPSKAAATRQSGTTRHRQGHPAQNFRHDTNKSPAGPTKSMEKPRGRKKTVPSRELLGCGAGESRDGTELKPLEEPGPFLLREELQSQDTPASAGPADSLPGSQDSCRLPKAGACSFPGQHPTRLSSHQVRGRGLRDHWWSWQAE